jgi:AcrR family transcriptional regulator
MDQIAGAAGVGKGTLFRRFGDKAGLAVAVLEEQETRLRQATQMGPPPLGPGAPPADRLRAFLVAYVEFLDANLDLVHLAETASPGARYRVGGYLAWQRHVRGLVHLARPDLDAEFLAHALLAPLASDLRRATARDYPTARAAAAMSALAGLVVSGQPS